jgi:ankyrin repeat protein
MALTEKEIGEFIDAAVRDHVAARKMIEARPELLNARWMHNETILHFLAVEGYVDAVRFLATAGAAIDEVNEFGDTALIDVTVLGNVEIAKLLLKHGANPNAPSNTRDNPLGAAVWSGNLELVELLLAAGARAEFEDLWLALQAGRVPRGEMEAVLARYGISPASRGGPVDE